MEKALEFIAEHNWFNYVRYYVGNRWIGLFVEIRKESAVNFMLTDVSDEDDTLPSFEIRCRRVCNETI